MLDLTRKTLDLPNVISFVVFDRTPDNGRAPNVPESRCLNKESLLYSAATNNLRIEGVFVADLSNCSIAVLVFQSCFVQCAVIGMVNQLGEGNGSQLSSGNTQDLDRHGYMIR